MSLQTHWSILSPYLLLISADAFAYEAVKSAFALGLGGSLTGRHPPHPLVRGWALSHLTSTLVLVHTEKLKVCALPCRVQACSGTQLYRDIHPGQVHRQGSIPIARAVRSGAYSYAASHVSLISKAPSTLYSHDSPGTWLRNQGMKSKTDAKILREAPM